MRHSVRQALLTLAALLLYLTYQIVHHAVRAFRFFPWERMIAWRSNPKYGSSGMCDSVCLSMNRDECMEVAHVPEVVSNSLTQEVIR